MSGIKQRVKTPKFQEFHNQAQLFYNSLSPIEQAHLTKAFSFELDHCDDPLVFKPAIARINDVDRNLAQLVANNVGGTLPEKPGRPNHGKRTTGLSQFEFMPKVPTIKSRRIAILLADGFDMKEVTGMKTALLAAGAVPFIIGPRRGTIYSAGESKGSGKGVQADHHFEGQRSTMFDALFIPGGGESVKTLAGNGRSLHWMLEAFGHLKTIGAVGEGALVFLFLSRS